MHDRLKGGGGPVAGVSVHVGDGPVVWVPVDVGVLVGVCGPEVGVSVSVCSGRLVDGGWKSARRRTRGPHRMMSSSVQNVSTASSAWKHAFTARAQNHMRRSVTQNGWPGRL